MIGRLVLRGGLVFWCSYQRETSTYYQACINEDQRRGNARMIQCSFWILVNKCWTSCWSDQRSIGRRKFEPFMYLSLPATWYMLQDTRETPKNSRSDRLKCLSMAWGFFAISWWVERCMIFKSLHQLHVNVLKEHPKVVVVHCCWLLLAPSQFTLTIYR